MKRRDMDERIKTMREQNIKDLFGDYRRHGAVYLLAMTMPENQQRVLPHEEWGGPRPSTELGQADPARVPAGFPDF